MADWSGQTLRGKPWHAHNERHLGVGRVEMVTVGHDAVLAQ